MRKRVLRKINSWPQEKVKAANIGLMTAAVVLIFGSYLTMGNIQTVILENAGDRDATGYIEDFNGDGCARIPT